MIQIIPGINEKDIKELVRKVTSVAPHVDYIQIDIGDNTIIPCESYRDIEKIGAGIAPCIANGTKFEAHLMVGKPRDYISALVTAGFSRIIAHVECDDPREFLADARTHEIEVGLAIDTETDFEVIEPFLEDVDVVLVMTVEAGSSGQLFEPETMEKVKIISRNLPDLPIEVDGGMTPETMKIVKEAGATRAVSTSYIFTNEQDIASALDALANG